MSPPVDPGVGILLVVITVVGEEEGEEHFSDFTCLTVAGDGPCTAGYTGWLLLRLCRWRRWLWWLGKWWWLWRWWMWMWLTSTGCRYIWLPLNESRVGKVDDLEDSFDDSSSRISTSSSSTSSSSMSSTSSFSWSSWSIMSLSGILLALILERPSMSSSSSTSPRSSSSSLCLCSLGRVLCSRWPSLRSSSKMERARLAKSNFLLTLLLLRLLLLVFAEFDWPLITFASLTSSLQPRVTGETETPLHWEAEEPDRDDEDDGVSGGVGIDIGCCWWMSSWCGTLWSLVWCGTLVAPAFISDSGCIEAIADILR